jgi:hypothetical protein
MKMRSLLMGLLIAAAQGATAAAMADVLEIVVPTKAGVSPPDALAVILVDGASKNGPYDSVKNKTLDYIIAARGDKPKKATFGGWLNIYLGDGHVEGDLSSNWSYHKISASYRDPRSNQFAGLTVSPVDLCNERLNQTSGAARETFLKKGVSFPYKDAYEFSATVEWFLKKPMGFDEPKTYAEKAYAPVAIRCMALGRVRASQDTSTTGAPPREGKPLPPTISRATIRIEPAKVVQDGKFLCPTQLKLYGYVKTNRDFYGKALFVGPHYLSAITTLNIQGKGSRNVSATYDIDWHKAGGFTTTSNSGPKPQTLTFRFNIADKDNKLRKQVEETIEVSCKKIKVGVPTVGDEMTIKPAN